MQIYSLNLIINPQLLKNTTLLLIARIVEQLKSIIKYTKIKTQIFKVHLSNQNFLNK